MSPRETLGHYKDFFGYIPKVVECRSLGDMTTRVRIPVPAHTSCVTSDKSLHQLGLGFPNFVTRYPTHPPHSTVAWKDVFLTGPPFCSRWGAEELGAPRMTDTRGREEGFLRQRTVRASVGTSECPSPLLPAWLPLLPSCCPHFPPGLCWDTFLVNLLPRPACLWGAQPRAT